MDINYSFQLEIIAGEKIVVPGCEPTSALSSVTLSRAMSKCKHATVDLGVVLAAIPGSYVKFMTNFAGGNHIRKRFIVFPPVDISCPCVVPVDYYAILRSLVSDEEPITEKFDYCDIIGMGFCPSPDFKDAPAPSPSPYFSEGQYPAGILIPPGIR